MSLYQWLIYVHILGAITWIGVGIAFVLLGIRAEKTGTVWAVVDQMEWLSRRVGAPSVIVMAATGIWMVARSEAWSFAQGWVSAGFAGLILFFLMGVGVHAPNYRRIRRAQAEHGHDSPEAMRLVRRSFLAGRIEVGLMAVVVWIMVAKPWM